MSKSAAPESASEQVMDRGARLLGLASTTALLLVAVMVVAEVISRAIFGYSMVGVADISGLVVAVAVAAALPVVTLQRGHLIIELLKDRIGARATSVLGVIGGLFLLLALVILAWRIGISAAENAARDGRTQVIGLQRAPFLWAVTFFIGLAAISQFLLLVMDVRKLVQSGALKKHGTGMSRTVWLRSQNLLPLILAASVVVILVAAIFRNSWLASWVIPAAPLLVALLFFAVMWTGGLLLFPLGAVLLLSGFAGIVAILGLHPAQTVIATRTIELLSSDILLVIPLFMLMGSFAQAAGLSTDVYRLAYALIGHHRGGLALATVGACAGFGAMTGSSIATAITIGHAAYPEMRRHGYSKELSTGCIAAGGTLGQLVPPSAVMVLYAILTETSVGQLFIAAALPAALIILLFIVSIAIQVRRNPSSAPPAQRREPGELAAALVAIWPSAGLIALVIGGIYTGIFTVAEAASVGAVGALLLAAFRGRLGSGVLARVMTETAERTAMVYMLIIGGSIFAFFIGVTRLPVEATELLGALNLPGTAVVAIALVIYILLGMIMEAFAIMIITVPVITPILLGFNYDLIWWGIVMVVVVEIGLLTPPFGMNAFILKTVAADVPLGTVFKGIIPFVIANIVGLIILVAFPELALWLPQLLK